MEVVNLLDFIKNIKDFYALDCATCSPSFANFLNIISEDEQFTHKIDLGIIYIKPKTMDQYTIVDGLNRILALSLLLHAVCECYKKTTPRNERAITTIRTKYLLDGSRAKLRLLPKDQEVYDKIIFGERLSGKEKQTPMFQTLHAFWTHIKTEGMQAAKIFNMLDKIQVTLVDTEAVPPREVYYNINKFGKDLNHLLLIENYLKDIGIKAEWENLQKIFKTNNSDINLFFKDFFITKFNFKEYDKNRLYEFFVNYFETVLQYLPEDVLIEKLKRSANLYHDILNVRFDDEDIRKAMIAIKMHNGEDTYAYLLNIYEDFIDNNISRVTFLEILSTIDEYLRNRLKTPNNVDFNELIKYLNAFLTCK